MRSNEENTYCLRHPEVESNLRCGRCGDLICPRCMVTSPVGARCPTCARIGRPAILDTSGVELGRATLTGLVAAIVGGLVLAAVVRALVAVPAISATIGIYLAAAGIVGLGYGIGEAIRYGSGNKLDRRLKYIAAGGVFLGWLSIALFLPVFGVSSGFLGNPISIVGLIIAFYVAMGRLRIP